MKSTLLSFVLTVLAVSLVFSSCKKERGSSEDFTVETSTHSDDQSRFSAEVDAVANDANLLLESSASFSGRPGDLNGLICDASVVIDTAGNARTITITYDGTNCLGNRTRTGTIVISMAQATRWRNAGAAISVTYQNFKVTRTRDNKSITVNGTQTFTNVSGGLLIELPVRGSITHTITSSNMSVTFDDGSQRTWQVARQRVFSLAGAVVSITISGTHTEAGVTGIAEWGTNRFGRGFTTVIAEPIVLKSDCSFRAGSGKVIHSTAAYSATTTLGLDSTGTATTCPGTGNYYMKISWTGPGGNTRTVILPY